MYLNLLHKIGPGYVVVTKMNYWPAQRSFQSKEIAPEMVSHIEGYLLGLPGENFDSVLRENKNDISNALLAWYNE